MSYSESVLTKLLNPGILLLLVGAILVYGSAKLTRIFVKEENGSTEKVNLIIKIVGTVVAIGGALLVFIRS